MEDSQIVDLYWERNEQAIRAAASKYGGYCYSIAYNILRSREDADESVNDTYLGAWNAMPPQRPNCLRTFLGKITRRVSLKKCGMSTGISGAATRFLLRLRSFQNVYHPTLQWRRASLRGSSQRGSTGLSVRLPRQNGRFFSAATGIWTRSTKSARIFASARVR